MSNRAYADLMFAWAHARLGDPAAARPLAEDAALRLSTGDAAHQWLANAFTHRIDQVVRGEAHAGEWPMPLLKSLAGIDDANRTTTSRQYIVDRLRYLSRILEPDLRTDPWAVSKRYSTRLQFRLAELAATTDPLQFAGHFGSLLADTAGPDHVVDRQRLILVAANHGRRAPPEVVEVINREGLWLIDRFLRDPPDLPEAGHHFRTLAAALCDLAVSRQDGQFVGRVTLRLADWVRYGDHATGLPLAVVLFDVLLPRLYRGDLAADAALLLDLVSESGDILRPAPDDLLAQLQLAGCERWLGLRSQGERTFAEVRSRLAGGDGPRLNPGELVRVAEGYLQARGRGPVSDFGADLLDLFDRLPRVPNGFTTATHFSRLHLGLTEAAVLAVTTDDFRPNRDLHARLGTDEAAARRTLLPELRNRIRTWAEPDW